MASSRTIEQLESLIGERIATGRLDQNISQASLAARAGITRSALVRLEAGGGSSLRTFVAVVKALGHEDWLETVAPVTLNPFAMVEHRERIRASKQGPKRG